MTKLRIVLGQIHNPTNDWMSCVIGSSEAKISISPLPPRSTRPLPANTVQPQIVQEAVLAPEAVAKFETVSATVSSSIVVEALELTIQGVWTGEARINEQTIPVSAQVAIKEKEISGWFKDSGTIYYFTGSLNTLSRVVVFACYTSLGTRFTDLRGRLQVSGGKYVITCQTGDFAFSLTGDGATFTEVTRDEAISGRYKMYYTKGPMTYEVPTDIEATSNGLVSGNGKEDERRFVIRGMVDRETTSYMFLRIKGNDVSYILGTAQIRKEVDFEGTWRMGNQEGGFLLTRVME